jgi:hypothetical protein
MRVLMALSFDDDEKSRVEAASLSWHFAENPDPVPKKTNVVCVESRDDGELGLRPSNSDIDQYCREINTIN